MLSPSLIRNLKRFLEYVEMHCDRRLTCGGSEIYIDVFTAIYEARHPKTGVQIWSRAELNSEAALLVLAGSDTTTTAITAALFYLVHNPRTLT